MYARAVNPNGPYKDACGEINVPVSLGNVVVEPGDIIVGDLDGLVAIHPGEACRVAEKAAEIAGRAQKKIEAIHRSGTMDLTWLHTKLDETGCRIR